MTSKEKEILKPYIDFKDHCIHRGLPFQTSEINLMSKFEVGLLNYFDEQSKTPTLSECIKEWKERGWVVKILNDGKLIDIVNSTKLLAFQIDLKNKKYIKVDSVIYSSGKSITFEEHHLLSKTIKASEEIKDE